MRVWWLEKLPDRRASFVWEFIPVSYTHLDVYKRQLLHQKRLLFVPVLQFIPQSRNKSVSYTHLAEATVGYPVKLEDCFADSLEEQKRKWFAQTDWEAVLRPYPSYALELDRPERCV